MPRYPKEKKINAFPSSNYLEFWLADNIAVTRRHPFNCVTDHVVNNLLGWQLVVGHGSGLAHEEWSGIVEGIVINIITHRLHVVLNWNLASSGELLDLLSAVLLPVGNVWVVADTERTSLQVKLACCLKVLRVATHSEDNGADVVIEASCSDGLLMRLGCTSLLG
jgi:hypothetical protein